MSSIKASLSAIQGSHSHPAMDSHCWSYVHIFVGCAAVLKINISQTDINISVYDSLPYAILALIMMFYPLSGFIADICCGQLKTIVVSLVILLSCLVFMLIAILVGETITGSVNYALTHYKGILFISLSLFTFVFGLAGYQANCIQFGLDQLFEAPSQYLGLFIHYAMWVFQSGTLSFITLFSLMLSRFASSK